MQYYLLWKMGSGREWNKIDANSSYKYLAGSRVASRSRARNDSRPSRTKFFTRWGQWIRRLGRNWSTRTGPVSTSTAALRLLRKITDWNDPTDSIHDLPPVNHRLASDAEFDHQENRFHSAREKIGIRTLRPFLNILGGSLTLLSLIAPWGQINGAMLPLQYSGGSLAWAVPWIFAGGALSLLTSYGGLMTFLGILVFAASPYSYFGVFWTLSVGFYLALSGALTSILGSSWTMPQLTGRIREIAGGLMWAAGFVLIVTLVLSSQSTNAIIPPIDRGGLIVGFPLVCVGTLLAIVGVRMIFYPAKAEDITSKGVFEDSINRPE